MSALLVVLVGCGWLSAPVDEPTANTLTQGGATAKERLDTTRVAADLAAIRASIKVYRQLHEGENPPDLAALELTGLSFPDRYTYDATTGTVSDGEFPDL